MSRPAVAISLVAALAACGGTVQSKVETIPPAAVPTPEQPPAAESDAKAVAEPAADSDGDGLTGAADRCPNEAETDNGFEDDDGCPDELPLAQLDGNAIVMKQPLVFQSSGALDAGSSDTLDALAAVLKHSATLERIEVGAHMKEGGNASLDGLTSTARATAVVRALEARGVAAKRLSAKGYGGKCGHPKDGVRVVATQNAGKPTGVDAGCLPQ